MLSKKQTTWFKELCELDGVSGHEFEVAKYLKAEYEKLKVDSVFQDILGSIIAVKESKE